ncbi:MAG: hypothetical protein Rubg2KO_22380 [Rubricoccaceae bacterium]
MMRALLLAFAVVWSLAGCDSAPETCGGLDCDVIGEWTLISVDGEPAVGWMIIREGERRALLPTGSTAFPEMSGGFIGASSQDTEFRKRLDITGWGMSTPSGRLAADVYGYVASIEGIQMEYIVLASDARLVFPAMQTQSPVDFPGLSDGTRLVFGR